jgi:hypothetical protein
MFGPAQGPGEEYPQVNSTKRFPPGKRVGPLPEGPDTMNPSGRCRRCNIYVWAVPDVLGRSTFRSRCPRCNLPVYGWEGPAPWHRPLPPVPRFDLPHPPSPPVPGRFPSVYRCWSFTGELLYVGRSIRWPCRLGEHQDTKPWWTDVASVTVIHYDADADCDAAERRAIATENPVHNVALRLVQGGAA